MEYDRDTAEAGLDIDGLAYGAMVEQCERVNGEREGLITLTDASGTARVTGAFRNGRPHGEFIYRSESGTVSRRGDWSDGRLVRMTTPLADGCTTTIEWTPAGLHRRSINRPDGVLVERDRMLEAGTRKVERPLPDGRRFMVFVSGDSGSEWTCTWYRPDRTVLRTESWSAARGTRRIETYDEGGVLESTHEGPCEDATFLPDAIAGGLPLENGHHPALGGPRYVPNGPLTESFGDAGHFTHELDGWWPVNRVISTYPTGRPRTSANLDSGEFSGDLTSRHPNGQLEREGTMDAGAPVGVWHYWHGNGRLRARVRYSDGVPQLPLSHLADDGERVCLRTRRDRDLCVSVGPAGELAVDTDLLGWDPDGPGGRRWRATEEERHIIRALREYGHDPKADAPSTSGPDPVRIDDNHWVYVRSSGSTLFVMRRWREGPDQDWIDTLSEHLIDESDFPDAAVYEVALSPGGRHLMVVIDRNGREREATAVVVDVETLTAVSMTWLAPGTELHTVAWFDDTRLIFLTARRPPPDRREHAEQLWIVPVSGDGAARLIAGGREVTARSPRLDSGAPAVVTVTDGRLRTGLLLDGHGDEAIPLPPYLAPTRRHARDALEVAADDLTVCVVVDRRFVWTCPRADIAHGLWTLRAVRPRRYPVVDLAVADGEPIWLELRNGWPHVARTVDDSVWHYLIDTEGPPYSLWQADCDGSVMITLADGSIRPIYQSRWRPPSTPAQRPRSGVHRRNARSADRTRVPVSVRPPAIEPIGACLLQVYGGYGIPLPPPCGPRAAQLSNLGITVATAHIRGGGELGYGWELGGSGANALRSIEDAVAAAERLIELGYCTPESLIIAGASHGGHVALHAALNLDRCPAGVLLESPALNYSRYSEGHYSLDGPQQLKHEWRDLNAIRHRTFDREMPSILGMVGTHDQRVDWRGTTATLLRARRQSQSDNPVFLRVAEGVGHAGWPAFSKPLDSGGIEVAFIRHVLGLRAERFVHDKHDLSAVGAGAVAMRAA